MSTYRNRSTPGVYVTELNAFPNSIVGVQTAVAGFIGYTAKAAINGKPAYMKPIKINSLADFEFYFGGAYQQVYNIENATVSDADFAAQIWNETKNVFELTYYRYTMAGGIIRPFGAATKTDADPDADIETAANADADAEQQIDSALDIVGRPLAAFNLYDSVRLFYANGGGTAYVVSAGSYDEGVKTGIDLTKLQAGLAAMGEQNGPTLLVIPDAVLLKAASTFATLVGDMLAQCAKLQDRVAILDVYGTQNLDPTSGSYSNDVDAVIANFHQSVGDSFLNYGMAYFPFLVTSIIQPSEIDYLNFNLKGLINSLGTLTKILTDQAAFLYPETKPGVPDPKFTSSKAMIDAIPNTMDTSTAVGTAKIARLNQNLVNAIPLLQQMENGIAAKMSLLPASGAMAGIYSFTDATRGVWNAPANIVVSSVIQPSAKITADQQGDINAPLDGKAVNVIRDFVGRGPVVWGARTLDANSLDWRYIQVRRTLIYVETSIRTALNQFVFAPNDGKTWVAATAMVSGFLQNLWSQGGLMGDKASDAFNVQCGLGSTMTGTDILQGYMIVQVTLQMIRPAEFIELTFKQKMEGVA